MNNVDLHQNSAGRAASRAEIKPMEGWLLNGLGKDGKQFWNVAEEPVQSGARVEVALDEGLCLPVPLGLSRDRARIRWATRGGQA